MIRVFLVSGTYVEIPNRTLEQFAHALREAKARGADMRAEGKLGEQLLIRTDAITHVAQYRDEF